MTFRDQDGTYKRLAAISGDRGESWSTPVITDMPDSRSKQSCGNLADSTSFLAGNPVNNKTRIPLAVTLSKTGQFFNTAYLLRAGGETMPELRYEGKAKRLGYHYPKSMVYNDYLYVAYATNKEDAEYTRVPLASLVVDTSTMNPPTGILPQFFSDNKNIEILIDGNRIINIFLEDYQSKGIVSIFNLNGQLLYHSNIYNGEIQYDIKHHRAGTYIIEVRTESERKTKLLSNW
jgi:hypothetical protein